MRELLGHSHPVIRGGVGRGGECDRGAPRMLEQHRRVAVGLAPQRRARVIEDPVKPHPGLIADVARVRLQRPMRQSQRSRGRRPHLHDQHVAEAIDLGVLVDDIQEVRVQREIGQVQRREGEQPQGAVGALLLGRALRARSPMRDACGICSTQPRLVRRCGPRHRLSHVHLNALFLIAHRAGTGRAPEPPAHDRTPITAARHVRQPSDPPSGDGESASATARRFVRSLEVIYRDLARPWPVDELAACYQAADERGASDMPAGETPPDRPITLVATAIPRLISLAVAANVLHILPAAVLDAAIGNDVLGTLDLTAAGSLHRCHQALEAHAHAQGYDADEWLPLAYEQAADWLEHASAAVDPPALIDHAQQAGRYAAVAIGALDRDAPNSPEAITDTLAHLLTVCVIADAASAGRQHR